MSNIFKNVERGVESATSGCKKEYTELDKMSDAVACGEAIRKAHKAEKDKCTAEQCKKDKKTTETKERIDAMIMNSINKNKGPAVINKIFSDAKTGLFKDIVFEMFYKSLILDEPFLLEQKDTLKYITDQYIDNNNGFNLLESAIKANPNSMLLKRMKTVCEAIANDVCKRKIEDVNNANNPDIINFDMNDDEKEKLDYGKDTLDVDRISSLVKKKVLTVVKDEQERSKEADDAIAEIEEEVKANAEEEKDDKDNDETEEKTEESGIENIRKAYNKVVLSKPVIEASTLFNSLLRSTYREFIMENVAITSADKDNIDKSNDRSENYDINSDEDDIMDDEDDIETSEINDDLIFEDSGIPSVNMDLVFAEAITKYTLMEMLYTIKLENYSYENINKLTEKLLNPVTEASSSDGNNTSFVEIRKEFFSFFNKILNLNDIDKNKIEIEKLKDNTDDITSFKSCVGIAIKELDGAKEKNAQFKDQYNDISEWLNSLLK